MHLLNPESILFFNFELLFWSVIRLGFMVHFMHISSCLLTSLKFYYVFNCVWQLLSTSLITTNDIPLTCIFSPYYPDILQHFVSVNNGKFISCITSYLSCAVCAPENKAVTKLSACPFYPYQTKTNAIYDFRMMMSWVSQPTPAVRNE